MEMLAMITEIIWIKHWCLLKYTQVSEPTIFRIIKLCVMNMMLCKVKQILFNKTNHIL